MALGILPRHVAAFLLCLAGGAMLPAIASPILLDWSPATLGAAIAGGDYRNQRNTQYFAETVSFGTDTLVNGMDIYSAARYGVLGTAVDITIWADRGGRPGDIVGQFGTALSAIDASGATGDLLRKHADFDGFTMLANTRYWIGMAGSTVELAQAALLGVDGGDGRMARFSKTNFYAEQAVSGDLAFRLYGQAGERVDIPLPGTLPLVGLAGMALLLARRRRA